MVHGLLVHREVSHRQGARHHPQPAAAHLLRYARGEQPSIRPGFFPIRAGEYLSTSHCRGEVEIENGSDQPTGAGDAARKLVSSWSPISVSPAAARIRNTSRTTEGTYHASPTSSLTRLSTNQNPTSFGSTWTDGRQLSTTVRISGVRSAGPLRHLPQPLLSVG